MFYNMATRKQSLKNVSDQYQRIMEVVQRYAIHYSGQNKSFVCKKHRDTTCDVNITQSMSQLDAIKSIFGASLAYELLPFRFPDKTNQSCQDESKYFSASGYVSNANYKYAKIARIFFIIQAPLIRCNYCRTYE
jgi:DNA mismatch repair protein MLH1